MKQAAGKPHQRSVAAPGPGKEAGRESASLKAYFGSWLNSVAPGLSKIPDSALAPKPLRFKRSITAHDMVRVNRATVREGTAHRHWPPDVVAQFLTAEVITRKTK